RRVHQRLRQSFLQAYTLLLGAVRSKQVGAQDQEQCEDKYEERYDHCLHLLEEDAWQLQTASLQPFGEPWTNTCWTEATQYSSIFVDSRSLVLEDFLHRDRFAFHAGDFRNRRHATRAVRHARNLHDHVQSRSDLLAHCAIGQTHTRHLNHRLETGHSIARCVGVDGSQTAVVTSVHSLKHVNCFATANLTDHDAIGTHTQGVLDEISLRNFTATFNVGRSGFESDGVRLLKLKFG